MSSAGDGSIKPIFKSNNSGVSKVAIVMVNGHHGPIEIMVNDMVTDFFLDKPTKVTEIQVTKTGPLVYVTLFLEDGNHVEFYDVIKIGYKK